MRLSVILLLFTVSIWGNIDSYTDHGVTVDGKAYGFTKEVVIDTYSLEKDRKGNVRIEVNENGNVEKMYFYGIDMPEAIRVYKKGR